MSLYGGFFSEPSRPKGGIEQARRNLMRDDPALYAYIEARVAARELDRAGGDASGARDNYGAANRIWALSASWENKWRAMLPASPEVPTQPPTSVNVAVLVENEDADPGVHAEVGTEAGMPQIPRTRSVRQPEDVGDGVQHPNSSPV